MINFVLILLSMIILTASGVYVLIQDWRATTNRLFALFALSAVLLLYCAVLRFTGSDPWEVWFVYGLSAPLLALSFFLVPDLADPGNLYSAPVCTTDNALGACGAVPVHGAVPDAGLV